MPNDAQSPRPKSPTTQPSHDSAAFSDYRTGLEQSAAEPIPPINRWLLVGTLIALIVATVGTFGPWLDFTREDGTTGSVSGIRSDGLILVISSVAAAILLVVAAMQKPGHGDFQALLAFGAIVLGFLAVGYTMMDPSILDPGEPDPPASFQRGWGLQLAFVASIVSGVLGFRLWRDASNYS